MDQNLKDTTDKFLSYQKQVTADAKTMQTYISDLLTWESEMKRKEAALKEVYEQDLPPVRSKKKKLIQSRQSKPEARIKSSDYAAWDSFDVDKACEQVDMADVGPSSLDSKKSLPAKTAKLSEEAVYEKERGNNFVKQEKWDEAIKCYSRAIEIDNRDAIFYANRALCYLKIDKLHNAESDCTQALKLDPTYVKAFLRRATAREKLGSLKAASEDLTKVLQHEPHNNVAKQQLANIKTRMGSKGGNKKSSPQQSPTADGGPAAGASHWEQMIKEADSKTKQEVQQMPHMKTALEKWKDGTEEGLAIIKPVKKPPHLRSKRSLKPITIKEIQLGKNSPETKPPTRILITEVDNLSHGDTNNNKKTSVKTPLANNSMKPDDKGDSTLSNGTESEKKNDVEPKPLTVKEDRINVNGKNANDNENGKATDNDNKNDKTGDIKINKVKELNLVVPNNSVQFLMEWRALKDFDGGRSDYLSMIDPKKFPAIFDNALESDILSSVLYTLAENPEKFTKFTTAAYLQGLAGTKRFSALAMFLSTKDKHLVNNLLVQCKAKEACPDEVIADLKNKFEI